MFCWLCAFCTNNNNLLETDKLSEIVWYKYPRVCSACAVELNENIQKEIDDKKAVRCKCDQTVENKLDKHVDNTILKAYRRSDKPFKLDDWVEMFDAIFGHRLYIQSLDSICFHFVEEVGEVTTALRNFKELEKNIDQKNVDRDKLTKLMAPLRINDIVYELLKAKEENNERFFAGCQKILRGSIKEELADVFSWLCALVINLLETKNCYTKYENRFILTLDPKGHVAEHLRLYDEKPLKLSSIVYLEYAGGCPTCENLKKKKGLQCICEIEMSPTII